MGNKNSEKWNKNKSKLLFLKVKKSPLLQKSVSIKNKEVVALVSELLGIKNSENLITEIVYKPVMPGVKDRVMEKP